MTSWEISRGNMLDFNFLTSNSETMFMDGMKVGPKKLCLVIKLMCLCFLGQKMVFCKINDRCFNLREALINLGITRT